MIMLPEKDYSNTEQGQKILSMLNANPQQFIERIQATLQKYDDAILGIVQEQEKMSIRQKELQSQMGSDQNEISMSSMQVNELQEKGKKGEAELINMNIQTKNTFVFLAKCEKKYI